MSIFHNVDQNSDSWFTLRMGKFTASKFSDIMGAPSNAGYKKEIYRVAYERLTFDKPESFKSGYMDRGNELEPFAIRDYELRTFETVTNGGFYELNEWIGASPDGMVSDGQIQVKCPAYNTHIDYLLSGKVPTLYNKQIQGEMYVTGRDWCDFVAYHPHMKPLIIRIERDEVLIKEIEEKLLIAIDKAKDVMERIR